MPISENWLPCGCRSYSDGMGGSRIVYCTEHWREAERESAIAALQSVVADPGSTVSGVRQTITARMPTGKRVIDLEAALGLAILEIEKLRRGEVSSDIEETLKMLREVRDEG